MMSPFDEKAVLASLEILIDNREQDTDRARRRYSTFGVPFRRATLSYGDYTYNATLPDGSQIHDTDQTVLPLAAVERKMDLTELANCFVNRKNEKTRDRFRREFERAAEQNSRIFLIVENASWENLYNGRYRSKFSPAAFVGSLTAWMVRYNLNLIFCKEETSGRLIREILYRDLKERIERGEFDK